MNFWTFLLVAILGSTIATILNNWIRARHGYPLEEEGDSARRTTRQVASLVAENIDLNARLVVIEKRLQTLEQIATDPAQRTAREIDRLRSDGET